MPKGATGQQNQIAANQQSFMNTLQQDFGLAFAGQQNIINGLTKSMNTTLQAGPSQFGFSTPEVTALNTLATTANAQAYQNARAAAGEAAAAAGQGGAQLPSGAAGAQEAQLAEQSAINQSNALLGIQEAGYKQGVQNYNEAVRGLTAAAGLENPTGIAGQANNAGEAAANTASQIQKANAAASPWAQVGGLVGSLAGATLNAFVPGAGTVVQGAIDSTLPNPNAGNSPQQLPNFAPAQGDTTNWSGLSSLSSPPDLSAFNSTSPYSNYGPYNP